MNKPTPDVCPMVFVNVGGYPDYDINTFCTVCPDAGKIPKGCKLTCGWPSAIKQRGCRYKRKCPCTQPAPEERLEAIARWDEKRKARMKIINDTFK
jgi:hypothetical protein